MIYFIIWYLIGVIGACACIYVDYRYKELSITWDDILKMVAFSLFGVVMLAVSIWYIVDYFGLFDSVAIKHPKDKK